jgi:hypothetical protein
VETRRDFWTRDPGLRRDDVNYMALYGQQMRLAIPLLLPLLGAAAPVANKDHVRVWKAP